VDHSTQQARCIKTRRRERKALPNGQAEEEEEEEEEECLARP